MRKLKKISIVGVMLAYAAAGANSVQAHSGVDEYCDILDMYYTSIVCNWINCDYENDDVVGDPDNVCYIFSRYESNRSLDEIGYSLLDINHDGQDELFISLFDIADSGSFYDMYTIIEGEIIHVITAGERSGYNLAEDNSINHWGSSGAASSCNVNYSLDEDGELVVNQAVIYDGFRDSENPYFYTDTEYYDERYGTNYDVLQPISAEEADIIKTGFPQDTVLLLNAFSEYDPFSVHGMYGGEHIDFHETSMKLYCRASEYATLRESASTSAAALTTIPSRGAVEYLGVEGSFYVVRYNGMIGYVLQDFFSSDRYAELNYGGGSSNRPNYTTLYCRASEYATLRESASTSAAALTTIPSRGAVEYLGVEGSFYVVRYNGMIGYVLQDFFSSDRYAELNYGGGSSYRPNYTTLYCRASEYATLRESASTSAMALVAICSRDSVQYLGESGDFYYVSHLGKKGYVLKNYFSTDPMAELNYGTN